MVEVTGVCRSDGPLCNGRTTAIESGQGASSRLTTCTAIPMLPNQLHRYTGHPPSPRRQPLHRPRVAYSYLCHHVIGATPIATEVNTRLACSSPLSPPADCLNSQQRWCPTLGVEGQHRPRDTLELVRSVGRTEDTHVETRKILSSRRDQR